MCWMAGMSRRGGAAMFGWFKKWQERRARRKALLTEMCELYTRAIRPLGDGAQVQDAMQSMEVMAQYMECVGRVVSEFDPGWEETRGVCEPSKIRALRKFDFLRGMQIYASHGEDLFD